MRSFSWPALVVSSLVALDACGGPGSTTLPPRALAGAANKTLSTLVPDNHSTQSLPPAANCSGPFPFKSASRNAQLISALGRTKNETIDVLYYFSCNPKATVRLAFSPSITLPIPPIFSTTGKQFYYALSQPPAAAGALQFRTSGPGNVTSGFAEFDATLTPLTLLAKQSYTLVFYALSGAPQPSQLLYVTNASTNSITAYMLPVQGNALPVRTIAGNRTGLHTPYGLAVDADGNLAVANAFDSSTASVEIFAPGADGNASPIRVFTAPNFPLTGVPPVKLALDPFSADIDVALVTDLSRVTTFSPLGVALRSLASDAFNVMVNGNSYPAAVWAGLNVDGQGRLVVGYNYADRFNSAGYIAVFAAGASGSQEPSYTASPPGALFVVASTYSRSANQVLLLDNSTTLYTQADLPTLPIIRIFGPAGSGDTFSSLAVDDTTGDVYASDTTTNVIWRLLPSGTGGYSVAGTIAGPNTRLAFPTSMSIGSP